MKIVINGKTYPCYLVMGAFLLFKRETGKDVSQLQQENLEDLLMLMWCCLKCSAQAAGQEFPFDFETFCNTITPDMLTLWNAQISSMDEKKTTNKT